MVDIKMPVSDFIGGGFHGVGSYNSRPLSFSESSSSKLLDACQEVFYFFFGRPPGGFGRDLYLSRALRGMAIAKPTFWALILPFWIASQIPWRLIRRYLAA